MIRENAVASDERVSSNRLTEDLHAEDVRHNLLRFLHGKRTPKAYAIQIGMEESDVVVAGNQIAERRQTLVDALYDDLIGK